MKSQIDKTRIEIHEIAKHLDKNKYLRLFDLINSLGVIYKTQGYKQAQWNIDKFNKTASNEVSLESG